MVIAGAQIVCSCTLKNRRTSLTYSACMPGTLSVRMCGTPGSAKGGVAANLLEFGSRNLGLVVHGVLAYRLPDLTASWAVAPVRKDRIDNRDIARGVE